MTTLSEGRNPVRIGRLTCHHQWRVIPSRFRVGSSACYNKKTFDFVRTKEVFELPACQLIKPALKSPISNNRLKRSARCRISLFQLPENATNGHEVYILRLHLFPFAKPRAHAWIRHQLCVIGTMIHWSRFPVAPFLVPSFDFFKAVLTKFGICFTPIGARRFRRLLFFIVVLIILFGLSF